MLKREAMKLGEFLLIASLVAIACGLFWWINSQADTVNNATKAAAKPFENKPHWITGPGPMSVIRATGANPDESMEGLEYREDAQEQGVK